MNPRATQKRHVADHPCKRCGGQITAWSPTQAEEQIYCSVKCRARDKRKGIGRVCATCGVAKDLDEYDKTESNSYRRSCRDCKIPYIPRAHRGMNRSPNPCPQCGKHWMAKMPPSAFLRRKYCSKTCQGYANRIMPKACNRCHRELPPEAYSYQPSGKLRRLCCDECSRNSVAMRANYHYFRPPPEELYRTARRQAGKQGQVCPLSKPQVRRIYNGPCAGCGGAVGHLVKKMMTEPMQWTNVRGLCRPCWLLHKIMPFEVMVQQAIDIAKHHKGGKKS